MPTARTEELHQAAENLRELRRAHADELHRARGGKLGSHHAAELLRQARAPCPFPNPDRRASCQRCAAAQGAQYRLLTETLHGDSEGIPDGVNTSAALARARQHIERYHLLAQTAPTDRPAPPASSAGEKARKPPAFRARGGGYRVELARLSPHRHHPPAPPQGGELRTDSFAPGKGGGLA